MSRLDKLTFCYKKLGCTLWWHDFISKFWSKVSLYVYTIYSMWGLTVKDYRHPFVVSSPAPSSRFKAHPPLHNCIMPWSIEALESQICIGWFYMVTTEWCTSLPCYLQEVVVKVEEDSHSIVVDVCAVDILVDIACHWHWYHTSYCDWYCWWYFGWYCCLSCWFSFATFFSFFQFNGVLLQLILQQLYLSVLVVQFLRVMHFTTERLKGILLF